MLATMYVNDRRGKTQSGMNAKQIRLGGNYIMLLIFCLHIGWFFRVWYKNDKTYPEVVEMPLLA